MPADRQGYVQTWVTKNPHWACWDIKCVRPLDAIRAHQEVPRFGITAEEFRECHGPEAAGLSPEAWNMYQTWRFRFARARKFPALTNSIIASHPKSEGLKRYKSAILRYYARRVESDAQRNLDDVVSMETFRLRTIRTTGPSAAEEAVSYRDYTQGVEDQAGGDVDRYLDDLLHCRDNLYFPMYHVVDTYAHGWLAT